MSREDVGVVGMVFEAVERRDSETILSLYDPSVEIESPAGTLAERMGGRALYRGHDGLRALERDLRDAFDQVETRCEELVDLGATVLSRSSYSVRGRSSGLRVEGPSQYGVWTVRDGRVTRVRWFNSREEALADAGESPSRPAA